MRAVIATGGLAPVVIERVPHHHPPRADDHPDRPADGLRAQPSARAALSPVARVGHVRQLEASPSGRGAPSSSRSCRSSRCRARRGDQVVERELISSISDVRSCAWCSTWNGPSSTGPNAEPKSVTAVSSRRVAVPGAVEQASTASATHGDAVVADVPDRGEASARPQHPGDLGVRRLPVEPVVRLAGDDRVDAGVRQRDVRWRCPCRASPGIWPRICVGPARPRSHGGPGRRAGG